MHETRYELIKFRGRCRNQEEVNFRLKIETKCFQKLRGAKPCNVGTMITKVMLLTHFMDTSSNISLVDSCILVGELETCMSQGVRDPSVSVRRGGSTSPPPSMMALVQYVLQYMVPYVVPYVTSDVGCKEKTSLKGKTSRVWNFKNIAPLEKKQNVACFEKYFCSVRRGGPKIKSIN